MPKITKILKCFIKPRFYKSYLNGVSPLFELEPFFKKIKHLETLIDVGSNKGQFSILCRDYFKNIKIYSFEPQKDQQEIHKKILGKINSIYSNYGISNKNTTSSFYITKRKDSSSIHKPLINYEGKYQIQEIKKIKLVTLNKFFKNKKIKSPSIMKIDIQGHELEALSGANNILKKIDFIIVELSFIKTYSNQANFKKIKNLLKKNSYRIVDELNHTYLNKKIYQKDVLFKKV